MDSKSAVKTIKFKKTGITVANFCSVRSFRFDQPDEAGNYVLDSCSMDRVYDLLPDLIPSIPSAEELTTQGFTKDVDGITTFTAMPIKNTHLIRALDSLQKRQDIDVILVTEVMAKILISLGVFNGKLRIPFCLDYQAGIVSHRYFFNYTPISLDVLKYSHEPVKKKYDKFLESILRLFHLTMR